MINNYIEKLDSSDIRWFDFLIHDKGKEDKALNSILHDLDCTRIYNDGSRPMMTINYTYRRDIAGFLYILENMKSHNAVLAEEYYNKLITRHEENLNFEKDNPPIRYSGKSGTSRKSSERTTRAKDMFSDSTLDVTKGSARAVTPKENASTRKAKALKDKSISFAFNNFKVNK